MSLDEKIKQAYVEGCQYTHENWMRALNETKGIGKKRRKEILLTMERICREKVMK